MKCQLIISSLVRTCWYDPLWSYQHVPSTLLYDPSWQPIQNGQKGISLSRSITEWTSYSLDFALIERKAQAFELSHWDWFVADLYISVSYRQTCCNLGFLFTILTQFPVGYHDRIIFLVVGSKVASLTSSFFYLFSRVILNNRFCIGSHTWVVAVTVLLCKFSTRE